MYSVVQPLQQSNFKILTSPPKGYFLAIGSQLPLPCSVLGNSNLLPGSVDLLYMASSYKWNDTIYGFFFWARFWGSSMVEHAWVLTSFSLLNSVPIHFMLGNTYTTTAWKPSIVVVLTTIFSTWNEPVFTPGKRSCRFHSFYYLNVLWRERNYTLAIWEVFDSYFHCCFKDVILSMVEWPFS